MLYISDIFVYAYKYIDIYLFDIYEFYLIVNSYESEEVAITFIHQVWPSTLTVAGYHCEPSTNSLYQSTTDSSKKITRENQSVSLLFLGTTRGQISSNYHCTRFRCSTSLVPAVTIKAWNIKLWREARIYIIHQHLQKFGAYFSNLFHLDCRNWVTFGSCFLDDVCDGSVHSSFGLWPSYHI